MRAAMASSAFEHGDGDEAHLAAGLYVGGQSSTSRPKLRRDILIWARPVEASLPRGVVGWGGAFGSDGRPAGSGLLSHEAHQAARPAGRPVRDAVDRLEGPLDRGQPRAVGAVHVQHEGEVLGLEVAADRRVVAAAAQDYFFDNGFRQFISRVLFNTIPVPRKISVSADPLRHVVRALREGYGVVLYPEGTRSRTGELGPFRSGIGRLAAEFPDVPIIPVWLEGTGRVLPRQGLPIPRPVKVNVRFGEPLKSERAWLADKSTWKVMAGRVREAVVRLRLRPNQAAD